ncbi:TPA_asm: hypothetical protein vir520_00006 [Caudoviricetes sp. vir520]|nr:TPA_asm: hypothetical protein vir520_00006 [Caudoviricetes sp. vir520]
MIKINYRKNEYGLETRTIKEIKCPACGRWGVTSGFTAGDSGGPDYVTFICLICGWKKSY